jgi:hypothetical protein
MKFDKLAEMLLEGDIQYRRIIESSNDDYIDMFHELKSAMVDEFKDVNAKWEDYCEKKDIDPNEMYDRATRDGYAVFFSKLENRQKWEVLKFDDVLDQWNRFAANRELDPDVMVELSNTIVRNIIKMELNNVVTGHSESNPVDEFADEFGYDDDMEVIMARMCEWIPDDKFSDYAMKPLFVQAEILLANMNDSSQESLVRQLTAIDRVFNITHQRSYLVDNFLEGGVDSYNRLAGVEK